MESRQIRRRRKTLPVRENPLQPGDRAEDVQTLFLPDDFYTFQEGHYDGVIKRFRETHVTAWPTDVAGLHTVLSRLQGLFPSQDTQTHLLHLAADGEILPHVDNVGASGSWILGVSLGASRILRLENTENQHEAFDIPLISGSVYVQKYSVRYGYQHSILNDGFLNGTRYNGGQRLSIIVRDCLPTVQIPG
ncbi:uncharacterized protein FIBRA_01346 [Fibroporia radiculosa]|uniref:Alpha-ketoglutarate-dependent dioxygenase AlkB-like domain-containing protein n=1 Tax=Fibroporia radiculosa TaxID=599839 RepID=J4G0X8_9APHY|nr:uncharacterized protein FIBRA_01346 [Fibroporia radiculosa]CCL99328.1 predicted protein [Fibroporia radiculosa]